MDKPTSSRASHSSSSSARTCSIRFTTNALPEPPIQPPPPPGSSTRPQHPPNRILKSHRCEQKAPSVQGALVGGRGALRASVRPTKALCPRSPRRLAVCAVRRRLEPARCSLACHPWPRLLFVTGNMPPLKLSGFAAQQELAMPKVHREANGAASFAGRRAIILQ